MLLVGGIDAPIGPFDARLAFTPTGGGARVAVPPLGSLAVDAFDGPFRLDIALQGVDQDRAKALASDPVRLAGVVDDVSADLRSAVLRLLLTTAAAGLGGAALASLVVFRRRKEPLLALAVTAAVLAGTAGVGVATWRPEALSQPRYTGLLVNANSLIGSARDIVARFDAYRASLEELVANVGNLYSTLAALPPAGGHDSITVLHVSDLHLSPAGFDLMSKVVDQFKVDAVLDTGDITDWGSSPENQLITAVGRLGVPYVFIRGNHDSAVTGALIAAQPNAHVLDDSGVTVAGLEIVGAADPLFTPDKSTGDDHAGDAVLTRSGTVLAGVAAGLPEPPLIALVHDPKQALPLDGVTPLVLAGHTHQRKVQQLPGGTRLMIEGSTGGAGLRGLQGKYPQPLTCTVLYLDPGTGVLRAYDEITLGGLGETQVAIQRTVVPETGASGGPEPGSTSAPASPTG